MKRILVLIVAIVFILTGCSEAGTASYNTSVNADNFKTMRQITFVNTMTGDYLFTVTGNCSITVDSTDSQLEVICKVGNDSYQKHFFGISPTTAYVVEELGISNVDPYHYQIVWKPQEIIPDIDIQTSGNEELYVEDNDATKLEDN